MFFIARRRRFFLLLVLFVSLLIFSTSFFVFNFEQRTDSSNKRQNFLLSLKSNFLHKMMPINLDYDVNRLNKIYDEEEEDEIVDDSDDDYDYEYDNVNPEFKEGDFDSLPAKNNKNNKNKKKESSKNFSLLLLLPSSSSSSSSVYSNDEEEEEEEMMMDLEKGRKSDFYYKMERKLLKKKKKKKKKKKMMMRNETIILSEVNGMKIIEEKIFWSKFLEDAMPKGLSDEFVSQFVSRVRKLRVVNIEPPSWNRCGRPKNQFITLSDGSHMCARYRWPHDYLIQGELMSFYLARQLGINNVPAVVLSRLDESRVQWCDVEREGKLKATRWVENGTIALIEWIEDDLVRDSMPKTMLKMLEKKENISRITLTESKEMNSSMDELMRLVQWSDLVVFDFITANYDRVASVQDAAEKEGNPSLMEETIHNLVKSTRSRSLWLIDNESGLVDAYSLLYSPNQSGQQSERFLSFHRQILSTFCAFRKSTFQNVRSLHLKRGEAAEFLMQTIREKEPLFHLLSNSVQHNQRQFAKHFQRRIDEVYRHMMSCAQNN